MYDVKPPIGRHGSVEWPLARFNAHPGLGPGPGAITVDMTKAKTSPSDPVISRRRARPLALVGLMGAGKTTIGRRLAQALDLPFVDADAEIEKAAGCTIAEIFERHGEAEFRRGERRVLERLLTSQPKVLATGGGAFMDAGVRTLIKAHAVSIWLRADLDLLMKRVLRRDTRPLLKTGNPRNIMKRLMDERYPVYAEADIVVDSIDGPHEQVVQAVIDALDAYYANQPPPASASDM